MTDHDWRDFAACKGMTDLFFPEIGAGTGKNVVYEPAVAICGDCAVVGPCGEAGMGEAFGVWGQMRPSERQRARQKRSQGRVA